MSRREGDGAEVVARHFANWLVVRNGTEHTGRGAVSLAEVLNPPETVAAE